MTRLLRTYVFAVDSNLWYYERGWGFSLVLYDTNMDNCEDENDDDDTED